MAPASVLNADISKKTLHRSTDLPGLCHREVRARMKIDHQTPATRDHVTRRGSVEYQISSPAFPHGVWGREDFTLTRHANGDRVLRAFCELDDEPALIRDVIQRVDAGFHPQDCMVRLTEGGVFVLNLLN